MMYPVEFFASVYRVSSYLCKAEATPCMRTGRDREDLSTPGYELLKMLLGSAECEPGPGKEFEGVYDVLAQAKADGDRVKTWVSLRVSCVVVSDALQSASVHSSVISATEIHTFDRDRSTERKINKYERLLNAILLDGLSDQISLRTPDMRGRQGSLPDKV